MDAAMKRMDLSSSGAFRVEAPAEARVAVAQGSQMQGSEMPRPAMQGPVTDGPVMQGAFVDAEEWVEERARLMNLLAQQQRLAQTGLLTAGLAHEISNHVMVIAGLSFAAQRSIDPTTWKDTLGQIEARCKELSQTMATILAFADRRESTLKTTFLASRVVDEAVRLLRPLACKQGVAFINEIQVDAQIAGDERALVQALVNLGSNAIRACAGKSTTLTIRVGAGADGKCRISVEDNGPGIPENLRRGLFRPFVTSQTDSNGHGLGLFIVRRAVVKLGGSIRVQTSSAGTTFHIDLPVHSPEAS